MEVIIVYNKVFNKFVYVDVNSILCVIYGMVGGYLL